MKENSLLVIIAAAGSGQRFGGDTPKQYMQLNGKSLLKIQFIHFWYQNMLRK